MKDSLIVWVAQGFGTGRNLFKDGKVSANDAKAWNPWNAFSKFVRV